MTIILGVDPSFNRTGWALVEAVTSGFSLVNAGIIVPKGSDRPAQLFSIAEQFDDALTSCQAQSAYFERPGAWQRKGGTRRETIEALSMSRAVMLLACAQKGMSACNVDVHVVRRAMFGRVNASQSDVLSFVARHGLSVPVRPRGSPDFDIANAIVMSLFGLLKEMEPTTTHVS